VSSLRREPGDLDQEFDVLVVGGGVYGAVIARMAARSGYSVALVDRADFGGGVSHNSLKIVHGGFRYIQHLDVPRIRESVAAQRAWMAAAPHLVRPMRCVVPTQGMGTRGPLAFGAAICAYQLAAGPRNAGVRPEVALPSPGLLSRASLRALSPQLASTEAAGGAYWYDAQMLDANRLVLECIHDAVLNGAVALNHMEVVQLRRGADAVEGAMVRDALTGRVLEVRARLTVNTAGPHAQALLAAAGTARGIPRQLVWTRNLNIVTPRVFDCWDAVGVTSRRPSDAAIGKTNRLFFVTRWQDCSIVGTSHERHLGGPDDLRDNVAGDVAAFLEEVREALPEAQLSARSVRYVHAGLTPAEDDVKRARRGAVIDHRETDAVRGLLSVLGIKYTTAPTVAHRVLKWVQGMLGDTRAPQRFEHELPGAPEELSAPTPWEDSSWSAATWARRVYGRHWPRVATMLPAGSLAEDEWVFRCRVRYGVEHEMVRLADAVFRATDVAERGQLTPARLAWCGETLAGHFGWDAQRLQQEISVVTARLPLQVAP
jgi:glycerol-3-phosphate dehydrogenase